MSDTRVQAPNAIPAPAERPPATTFAQTVAEMQQAQPPHEGWVYHQGTGELTHDGAHVATGYSGAGAGRNNPVMQNTPDTGPTPQGDYTVGPQFHSNTTGPGAMRLTPQAGTNTYGRGDLEVHGDSRAHPGEASHGCIILPPDIRHSMAQSDDHTLHVRP